MAKGDQLKPHQFKAGQSGNPSGKPKQLLTKDKVYSVLGKFSHLTREELQGIIQNPKSTMLEIMVASVMAKAAKDGDASRLEFLFQRSIGKVSDHIELDVARQVASAHDDLIDVVPRETIMNLLRLKPDGSNE